MEIMNDIMCLVQKLQETNTELPFYVYTSTHEQNILNIPVAKPLFILVISGEKKLGVDFKLTCQSDQFIFLSDNYSIHMRNIPKNNKYIALLIEFDHQDFYGLPINEFDHKIDYFIGNAGDKIKQCLKQFITISEWAPKEMLSLRKKELLILLYYLGYKSVASMIGRSKINHKIQDLLINSNFSEITTAKICEALAMSQSTLRRKLKSENTNFKEIKDRARLGLGLHLLQTTEKSISLISEKCGYQSQSRFTQNFKSRFGLTPSELRKTKQPL